MSLVTFCAEFEVLTGDYEDDDLLGYNRVQLSKAHRHFEEMCKPSKKPTKSKVTAYCSLLASLMHQT
jgi:hypothetical protein